MVTNFKNSMTKKSHLITSSYSKVLGKGVEKNLQLNNINVMDGVEFENLH